MSEQSDKYIAKNQKCISAAVKKLVFFGPQLVFFGPPDTYIHTYTHTYAESVPGRRKSPRPPRPPRSSEVRRKGGATAAAALDGQRDGQTENKKTTDESGFGRLVLIPPIFKSESETQKRRDAFICVSKRDLGNRMKANGSSFELMRRC